MGTYTIAAVSALEVRGPTLTLRYPRASDAAAIFELASDPEVTRFFSWGPYRKPEEVPEFLAGVPATRRRGEELALAIVRGDDLVGMTALMEFSLRDRRA